MAKHRIAYAASAAALALTGVAIPTNVLADDGDVCEASDQATFAACIGGTDGTIRLANDVDIDSVYGATFRVERAVELDLAGYKLETTYNDEKYGKGYDLFMIGDVAGEDASLTVTGNGSIVADGNVFNVKNGAVVTILNGEHTSKDKTVVYANQGGKVYVEDGTLTATSGVGVLSGNNTTGDMNYYIHGGILDGGDRLTVYMPGQVNLEVTGGELRGGILARMGQINITGGTIYSARDGGYDGNVEGQVLQLPGVINVAGGSYDSDTTEYKNDLNLNISGDVKLESRNSHPQGGGVVIYDLEKIAQNMNVTISGGDFKVNEGQSPVKMFTRKDILGSDGAIKNTNSTSVVVTGGTYNAEPDYVDLANYVKYTTGDSTKVYHVVARSEFSIRSVEPLELQAGDTVELSDLVSGPSGYEGWTYESEPQSDMLVGTKIIVPDVVEDGDEFTVTIVAKDADGATIASEEIEVAVKASAKMLSARAESETTGTATISFANPIEGDDLWLSVTKKEVPEGVTAIESKVQEIYDITVMDGDKVVPVENNEMTISAGYHFDDVYDYFQIAYVKNDTIAEFIDVKDHECNAGTLTEDGDSTVYCTLTFETSHLSEYGGAGSDVAFEEATVRNKALATTPDTGAMTSEGTASSLDTTALVATVVVMTLATAGMEIALWKKRQMRK